MKIERFLIKIQDKICLKIHFAYLFKYAEPMLLLAPIGAQTVEPLVLHAEAVVLHAEAVVLHAEAAVLYAEAAVLYAEAAALALQ